MSNNCERHHRYVLEGGCPAFTAEEMQVTVPVLIRAGCDVTGVEMRCTGDARITPNTDVCPGAPGAVCRFTISQRMRCEVPMVFTAEMDIGEGHVLFDELDPPGPCPCEGAETRRIRTY